MVFEAVVSLNLNKVEHIKDSVFFGLIADLMRAQKHSGDGGYNGKCEKCQAKVDSVQPDHPPWTHLENIYLWSSMDNGQRQL